MAVFEVMFLDYYTIQDSEKRLELIGHLRGFGDVPHDELTDSQLSSFIWNAAKVFNPDILDWSEIEPIEEFGIALWAAMAVTDERMMASAKYFPIDSRVGKTDPSVRVRNNIEIKKALRQQFEDYLNDNGITIGDPGILQSELIRRDLLIDINVPADVQAAPPRSTLQLLAKTATSVDLQWVQAVISDFAQYIVYYDTNPNIVDPTRKSGDLLDHVGVREASMLLSEITDQWDNALRVTALTANTVYYFVVGVQDLNGRITFSNELVVATEA